MCPLWLVALAFMRHVHVNGCRYAVWEAGPPDREVVAFGHGFLVSHLAFEHQAEALAGRGYRCIAWNWRGHGGSEVTEGGYHPWDLAHDVVGLLEALGVERCHYVGLSMGGYVGYRLARLQPDLVHTLALLDTSARSATWLERLRYYSMLAGLRLFGYRPLINAVMPILFGAPFLTHPARRPERARWKALVMANDRAGIIRAGLGIFGRDDVRHLLGAIRQPVLLLAGVQDRSHPVSDHEVDRDLLPDARLIVVPESGHSTPIEQPEAVTAALISFLHEHPIHG